MGQIDYKAEVLKVYPDAMWWVIVGMKKSFMIRSDSEGVISGKCDTVIEAWQDAYNLLKTNNNG